MLESQPNTYIFITSLGMGAQAQPLYPLGEEGFVSLVQEKDQVMVVALALKSVASQEWKVECFQALPHLHLMM